VMRRTGMSWIEVLMAFIVVAAGRIHRLEFRSPSIEVYLGW
jgi:hypothetical protein